MYMLVCCIVYSKFIMYHVCEGIIFSEITASRSASYFCVLAFTHDPIICGIIQTHKFNYQQSKTFWHVNTPSFNSTVVHYHSTIGADLPVVTQEINSHVNICPKALLHLNEFTSVQ